MERRHLSLIRRESEGMCGAGKKSGFQRGIADHNDKALFRFRGFM